MNYENPIAHFLDFIGKEGFSLIERAVKPDLPFVLSTVSQDGKPSSRVLFLKQIIEDELIFFTNVESQKGAEMQRNSNISMCFFFEKTNRQIRIEGQASVASKNLAIEYFKTRPVLSQAGAILSKQSSKLENYKEFVASVQLLAETKKELECPEDWVAFKVKPLEFEFWEGTEFRLHLRTKYKKELNSENKWFSYNLYP
jgi:pyridoxamine 5'-phosphate oxidase